MTPAFHDPFAVLLIHHPQADDDTRTLVRALAAWLTAHDPANLLAPGSNLPTYIFATPLDLAALAATPTARQAHRLAIILLADDPLAEAEEWRTWATTLFDDAHPAIFAPMLCALTPKAAGLLPADPVRRVDLSQFASAPSSPLIDEALVRVTARLLRALPLPPAIAPPETLLILSHDSHADPSAPTATPPPAGHLADNLARSLRHHIDARPAEDRYFAAIEPPQRSSGDRAHRGIDQFRRATVIVLHTDGYSSNPWCQHDVLSAKRYHRPMLVVDAGIDGEPRRFPHLANVRTLCWGPRSQPIPPEDPMPRRILAHALRETLFDRHTAVLLDALRIATYIPAAITFTRPPEFATLAELAPARRRQHSASKPGIIIYPDPPLSRAELDLFHSFIAADFLSLTQAIATTDATDHSLANLRIAISISESPDLADHGRSEDHIRRAWIAIARHLLHAGATLAYGGDLRADGYTTILADLLRAHANADAALAAGSVHFYLAWPGYLKQLHPGHPNAPEPNDLEHIEAQLRRSFPPGVDPLLCPPPADLAVDPTHYLASDTPENRHAWTRTLTVMRQRMAEHSDARIVLGGQFQSTGNWPGVAEEALEHLRRNKPLYLIGAYGGMARVLIDALEHRPTPVLTDEFQLRPTAKDSFTLRACRHRSRSA